ncbi:glycoside hydrolase family 35 [Colletotrichum camelliae]|nr:glycoside hydrolase family 35 [Colletotrichum camelliae]
MDPPAPRSNIVFRDGVFYLCVDGKPFLILGGQLAASSTSSAAYIPGLLNKLADTGANTIFAPVSWGVIEPVEASYDFSALDALIAQSNANGLRVVIQWFGSLKGDSTDNLSDHAPSWVKLDSKRFPRAKIRDDLVDDEGEIIGQTTRTIDAVSIFNSELALVEKRAVAALANHVRKVDLTNTTIMVQLGSGIGLNRDTRDCSLRATAAFDADVPQDMIAHFRAFGSAMAANERVSWEQLGLNIEAGEGLFSGYHFARYIDSLAIEVKKALSVPVLTTVPVKRILHGAPQTTGTAAVWKTFASHIDFWAPSASDAPYHEVCQTAADNNHPLMVIDHPRSQGRAEDMWTAFGSYGAIGIVVKDLEKIACSPSQIAKAFTLISDIASVLLDARSAHRKTIGFNLSPANISGLNAKASVTTALYSLQVTIERLGDGNHGGGCGLLIEQPGSKILLIGYGFQAKAKSVSPREVFTRVLELTKKEVEADGSLRSLRHFCGEETNSGRAARMPPIEPMIAEVQFYTLLE